MYRFIFGLPLIFGAITSHAIAQETNTTLPHLISAVVPGTVSFESSDSQQVAKSANAKDKVSLEALEAAIIRQNGERIRRIGTQGLRNKVFSLHQIRMLAEKFDSAVLLHSVNGAKSLHALHKEVKISLADSFSIAFFIESVISSHEEHYFSKKRFKLPRIVQRDPQTNKIYIHLETDGVAPIGVGKNKQVTKSILYDREKPELLAHSVSRRNMSREFAIHKALAKDLMVTVKVKDENGKKKEKQVVEPRVGLLDVHARFHNENEDGKKEWAYLTPIYSHKSLDALIKQKFKFTELEKVKIARDLLGGLYHMHARGIVHTDLHLENCFIDIRKNADGSREVKAVLGGLNRANFMKKIKGVKAQRNSSYLAPESFIKSKLKGEAYAATDIYALGCGLWNLLFEKAPRWGELKMYEQTHRIDICYCRVVHSSAQKKCMAKASALLKKYGRRTPKERLLTLILKMISLNPAERGNAKDLYRRFNKKYILLLKAAE